MALLLELLLQPAQQVSWADPRLTLGPKFIVYSFDRPCS